MDNFTELAENFIANMLQPSGTRCGKLVFDFVDGLIRLFLMKQFGSLQEQRRKALQF